MTESYEPVVFKFSGAGNDFVVLDGRQGGMEPFREPARIGALCHEYHTDGLMILTTPVMAEQTPVMADLDRPSLPDFVMEFYNPDGSGGMMCGNGGRCIVAFANYLGINPADGHIYHFLAPDGEHTAQILSQEIPGEKWTVRLKMIDVQGITPIKGGLFLNTGTRHLVQFVDQVDSIDMEKTAKPIRWDAAFQPEGTNVNFVEVRADGLHVRTFEKGVEGETLACGTGLTASAKIKHPDRIKEYRRRHSVPFLTLINLFFRLRIMRKHWCFVFVRKCRKILKKLPVTSVFCMEAHHIA